MSAEPTILPVIGKGRLDPQLMALALAGHSHRRGSKLRWVLIVLGALLGAVAALFLLRGERSAASIVVIFAAILATLWLLMSKRVLRRQFLRPVRKLYAQMGRSFEDVLYEFHQDHVRLQTKLIDTRMDWKAFCYWRVSDGLLLLYQNDTFFHVVPIDQFDTNMQTAVLATVKAHLPSA